MAESLYPGDWRMLQMQPGDQVKIEALAALQAAEVVAHSADNSHDRLSTLVTALAENIHEPVVGTRFWSQEYRPLLRLIDQSHSHHDIMLEACNPWLIAALHGPGDHPSCWANFRDALTSLGLDEKWIPYPIGFFRQAGEHNGRFQLLPATSQPGDHVTLETERALTLIVSCCPLSTPPGPRAPTLKLEVN